MAFVKQQRVKSPTSLFYLFWFSNLSEAKKLVCMWPINWRRRRATVHAIHVLCALVESTLQVVRYIIFSLINPPSVWLVLFCFWTFCIDFRNLKANLNYVKPLSCFKSMIVDMYCGCAAGSVTSSRRNHPSTSETTTRKRFPCQALET